MVLAISIFIVILLLVYSGKTQVDNITIIEEPIIDKEIVLSNIETVINEYSPPFVSWGNSIKSDELITSINFPAIEETNIDKLPEVKVIPKLKTFL